MAGCSKCKDRIKMANRVYNILEEPRHHEDPYTNFYRFLTFGGCELDCNCNSKMETEEEEMMYWVRVHPGNIAPTRNSVAVEASKQSSVGDIVFQLASKLGLRRPENYFLTVGFNKSGDDIEEKRLDKNDHPVLIQQRWPDTDQSSVPGQTFQSKYKFYLRNIYDTTCKVSDVNQTGPLALDTFVSNLFPQINSKKEYNDLCNLPDLNEDLLLKNLVTRFKQGKIYTYVGSILIAINPFKFYPIYNPDYVDRYQNRKLHELDPHIFAIADASFHAMLEEKRSQCVVISGESGSGKTESTNLLIHHLTALSQKGHGTGVEQTLLGAGPVLEAFGNAKTVVNNNSSRFGKFIQVNYRQNGTVHGAIVEQYLLEKSRIILQSPNERNYHVFYYLLNGATDQEREAFWLQKPQDYNYLNQSKCYTVDGTDERYEFNRLRQSMEMVGFSNETMRRIFSVLSAVLHIGNITFRNRMDHGESVNIKNIATVKVVSDLLRVKQETLVSALTKRKSSARGDQFVVQYKMSEAIATRDALAKGLYSALFDWIVLQVNHALLARNEKGDHQRLRKQQFNGNSIGVLDIFGFEDFYRNSFEQFCINYANEHLQYYFNQHVFKLEQEEYRREGILWESIDFIDNTECLHLIEKKPTGLIHILNDDCNFPAKDNDGHNLLGKFIKEHKYHTYFETLPIKEAAFIIVHYAGQVKYQVKDFREKNTDLMRPDIVSVLKNSQFAFVREMVGLDPVAVFRWAIVRAFFRAMSAFRRAGKDHRENPDKSTRPLVKPTISLPDESLMSQGILHVDEPHSWGKDSSLLLPSSPANMQPPSPTLIQWMSTWKARLMYGDDYVDADRLLKRSKSFKPQVQVKALRDLKSLKKVAGRNSGGWKRTSGAKKQPPTVSAQFQLSLNRLMETLNQANPFFVRCIKSNSQKEACKLDEELVMRQLRYTGMLETVRIRQSGYNVRLTKEEFCQHYKILLENGLSSTLEEIQEFLKTMKLDPKHYQIGQSKIFLRESERAKLQDALHAVVLKHIVVIQWWIRGVLQRRRYLRAKQGIITFQALYRGYKQRQVYQVIKEQAVRESAAAYLQGSWRAYKHKVLYNKLKRGVLWIQCYIRGNKARRKIFLRESERAKLQDALHAVVLKHIVVIQWWIRGVLQRRRYLRAKQGIITFQALYRGYKQRQVYQVIKEQAVRESAAAYLQGSWRAYKHKVLYNKLKRGVLWIQCYIRGNKARRKLEALLDERERLLDEEERQEEERRIMLEKEKENREIQIIQDANVSKAESEDEHSIRSDEGVHVDGEEDYDPRCRTRTTESEGSSGILDASSGSDENLLDDSSYRNIPPPTKNVPSPSQSESTLTSSPTTISLEEIDDCRSGADPLKPLPRVKDITAAYVEGLQRKKSEVISDSKYQLNSGNVVSRIKEELAGLVQSKADESSSEEGTRVREAKRLAEMRVEGKKLQAKEKDEVVSEKDSQNKEEKLITELRVERRKLPYKDDWRRSEFFEEKRKQELREERKKNEIEERRKSAIREEWSRPDMIMEPKQLEVRPGHTGGESDFKAKIRLERRKSDSGEKRLNIGVQVERSKSDSRHLDRKLQLEPIKKEKEKNKENITPTTKPKESPSKPTSILPGSFRRKSSKKEKQQDAKNSLSPTSAETKPRIEDSPVSRSPSTKPRFNWKLRSKKKRPTISGQVSVEHLALKGRPVSMTPPAVSPEVKTKTTPSNMSIHRTTQWRYPTNQVISDASELNQMDEFLKAKIAEISKSKAHHTQVDKVFRKAMDKYRNNLLTHQSMAMQDDNALSLQYKDLISDFEQVLQNTAKLEQSNAQFPITLGINAFRGFLDEFMHHYKPAKKKQKVQKKKKKEKEDIIEIQGHRFHGYQFNIPTLCESCNSFLWLMEKGHVCQDCKFTVHKKCMSKLIGKCKGQPVGKHGQVFGSSLSTLTRGSCAIPKIIEKCIFHIELHGLYQEGIYRRPGPEAKVKEIKLRINSGEDVDSIDLTVYSVLVVGQVLKAFFREMAEPLITCQLYDEFLRTTQIIDHKERVAALQEAIEKLPQTNHALFERLIFHLARIALNEEYNKMSASNLSIVFAPCVLRSPRQHNPWEALQDVSKQASCIELIISQQMQKVMSTMNDIRTLERVTNTASLRLSELRKSMHEHRKDDEIGVVYHDIDIDQMGQSEQIEEANLLAEHIISLKQEVKDLTANLPTLDVQAATNDGSCGMRSGHSYLSGVYNNNKGVQIEKGVSFDNPPAHQPLPSFKNRATVHEKRRPTRFDRHDAVRQRRPESLSDDARKGPPPIKKRGSKKK
ncbi:unconventional myosin-IXa-like [Anneissia japonica]|uniref:unconventional myosin-IXa-like n=1 Tax=Anneissia japonica TaxID=1529436 RepID=UPI001425A08A|nr:unconventional myosin-IXa-like [Anneissia japonica]